MALRSNASLKAIAEHVSDLARKHHREAFRLFVIHTYSDDQEHRSYCGRVGRQYSIATARHEELKEIAQHLARHTGVDICCEISQGVQRQMLSQIRREYGPKSLEREQARTREESA